MRLPGQELASLTQGSGNRKGVQRGTSHDVAKIRRSSPACWVLAYAGE
jgi:hypothetical protein